MELLLLNLLLAVPICAWMISKRLWPTHKWLVTGVGFGMVVSPLSMGLYATFFLSPLGLVTGLVGLLSTMFHGVPGYDASIYFGVVTAGNVVSGIRQQYSSRQLMLWYGGLVMACWGGALIHCFPVSARGRINDLSRSNLAFKRDALKRVPLERRG